MQICFYQHDPKWFICKIQRDDWRPVTHVWHSFVCGSQLKAKEPLKCYLYCTSSDNWRSVLIDSSIFISNALRTPSRLYRILLFYGANIPFDRLPLRIANFNRHSLPVLSRSSSNSGYFTIDVYCPTNHSKYGKITLKGNLYRKKPRMSGLVSMHQAEEK